ncbi:MAG: calcium/sodium antiporter [Candidatus Pacebacteria bacterium]|nr:calcium/sodium antiporter [Candidatus Paceibacterota bacterium]
MGLTIWIVIFILSLVALVKGSGWFLDAAEKIGFKLGLSSFVVGVLIVGFGTSLPELISSFVAVIRGVPDIVVSNAVGSNIANILLVIGLSTILTKKLKVSKNLIDSELPMLAISTVVFLLVIYGGDRFVSFGESVFLVVAYGVYLFYTIYSGEGDESRHAFSFLHPDKLFFMDAFKLIGGIVVLLIGAKYLVDALVEISSITNIAPGVISITAVAFGTSLPEVFVSVKAALAGKTEVAVGNIFGSNAFNVLMVVGLPGVINASQMLPIDERTYMYGIPVMALATFVFIISGISKTIYRWEGMMFLIFYALFTVKVLGIL